ncbi:hypothetical protein BDQ12DRAFT_688967 [Crucibulum laeve]|uniref:Uncharacterized protein n=1 Tax=Crucibulum laeve TaxID=68775 RepID=A0A5C3LQ41_9AGAR|nr:hypothetical protein BDQ12DRAFT_688967 [Crucibulum laeve]
MAGTKRASDSESGPTTRSSKVPKTESSTVAKAKAGKKGTKPAIPASSFKSKALPLHVNITHTPPTIAEDDTDTAVPSDVGALGSLTLVPSTFTTGSYGWKGSKRITVELQDSGEGEKEKVQVMLTINATVLGSKQAAKDEEEKEEEEAGDETKSDEEVSDDKAAEE